MNIEEYLINCLMEECAEVIHRASKAQRFGFDESPHDYKQWPESTAFFIPTATNPIPSNREKLSEELVDLFAMIELLEEVGLISIEQITGNREAIEAKKKKVKHFMKYAQHRGTLSKSN